MWVAPPGASIAEIMKGGGHAGPCAAVPYQHTTTERDRASANAQAATGSSPPVMALVPVEAPTDDRRTELAEREEGGASVS
jgi:hypothetical protein